MDSSPQIPVILVTGFLGSGKTTLLRRLAGDHPDWRMIFLVNEFADQSADQLTLDTTGIPTQSVVGGSLFCECKAGEFVRVMQEQVLGAHAEAPLDAVVIETSGIADPEAIGELMDWHGLADHFEVRRIVCVVAPKRFLSLLKNLPAVQAQVRTSDFIILNKTDLTGTDTVEQVEDALRRENPEATIKRAEHGKVPFDLDGTVRELPRHPLFTCEANPFSTETVLWPADRGVDQARSWLEALPPSILRIKGSLRTPEGDWQVQRTVDSLDIQPVGVGSHDEALALIAHDDDQAELETAARMLSTPASTE